MAKNRKRTGRSEEVIARKATQHHDFIGEAEPERQKSREATQARVLHDHQQLEKEIVREMAHEVEEVAGLREPAPAPHAPAPHASAPHQEAAANKARGLFSFERPRSLRAAIELIQGRGPEALELLRAKAEERLAKLPKPVVDFTGKAAGFLLVPVRLGTDLVQAALRTPAALWRLLVREKHRA